jgi:hypothetical protein
MGWVWEDWQLENYLPIFPISLLSYFQRSDTDKTPDKGPKDNIHHG